MLGSTGSVGVSTLDLLDQARRHGSAEVEVVALTAGRNVEQLAEQALRWRPQLAVIADETPAARSCASAWRARASRPPPATAAVAEAAGMGADWVMAAIVGVAGLAPDPGRGARRARSWRWPTRRAWSAPGPALLRGRARGGRRR